MGILAQLDLHLLTAIFLLCVFCFPLIQMANLTVNIPFLGFPSSSAGKESACNAGDPVLFLGREDPLEKGMATHASILAWRIPMDREAWWATIYEVTKIWT